MSITTRAPYGAETFYMPEEAFRLNPIARAFGHQPLLYGGGGGRRGGKGVVAAIATIAVPFVAPVLASTLAASTAIGASVASTVGMTGLSAATGAVLGAGVAAATGGDVGRGALMGGIGGGIAGYGMPNPAATATRAGTYGGSGGVAVNNASSSYFTPGTTAVAPTVAPAAAPSMQLASGAAPTGTSGYFAGTTRNVGGVDNYFTAATTPAQTFANAGTPTGVFSNYQSGIPNVGVNTASAPVAPSVAGPANTYWNPGTNTAGTAGTAGTNQIASTTGTVTSDYASGVGGFSPASAAAPTGAAAGAGGQYDAAGRAINPATGRPYTTGEALRSVPGAIQARFSDPRALADLTLRAAGAIAANEMGGGGDPYAGLTEEEKKLLQDQMNELNTLRTENINLFNQRLEQAQSLIGESKYFDPEYFGLQRARRAQLAGARAKRAGLRGLTGAAREAEARRFDLATGRDIGSAYDAGYGQGISGRLQTKQAGMAMMPTSFPSASSEFTNLANIYGSAAERSLAYQQRQAQGAGNIFAPIFG